MTDTIATTPTVDKTALRADLERARDASRALISEIPEAKWDATSGNPDFTCGQLAWHLASAVDFAAGLIENALKGKQTYFPSVLMPVGNRINAMRIRRGARGATRDSVLADYDRNHARLLRLLDAVTDAQFAIVKTNFTVTRSVFDMFRIPIEHIDEHGPEIRSAAL